MLRSTSSRRLRAALTSLGVASVLALAACGSDDTDDQATTAGGGTTTAASSAAPDKGGADGGKLVFAHSASVPQVVKLPQTLAVEQLADQGYEVEQQYLQTTTDSINAVLRGTATMGNSSPANFFAAVATGADLVAIAGGGRMDYQTVSRPPIKDFCTDAKRIAINNPISATDLVMRLEVEPCPDGKQILSINLTPTRIKALLADQIDATPVQLTTPPLVEREYAGKLNLLDNLAEKYPDTIGTVTFVKRSTLEERPKAIQDFVAAQDAVIEQAYEDPATLEAAAKRIVKALPAPDVKPSIELYLQSEVFPRDGGLGAEQVKVTYDQLRKTELLKKDLDPEQFVDRSFVDRVEQGKADS